MTDYIGKFLSQYNTSSRDKTGNKYLADLMVRVVVGTILSKGFRLDLFFH